MTHDQIAKDAVEPCSSAEEFGEFLRQAMLFRGISRGEADATVSFVLPYLPPASTPPPSTAVVYGETQSTVHKQSCDYSTVHNTAAYIALDEVAHKDVVVHSDAMDRRVEAIAQVSVRDGVPRLRVCGIYVQAWHPWEESLAEEMANQINAADPLTAGHAETAALIQTWQQMHDSVQQINEALVKRLQETAALLAEAGRVLKNVREQLGEAIHAGFRKGADCPEASQIWSLMAKMPDGQFGAAIAFALYGLEVTDALLLRIEGAAK